MACSWDVCQGHVIVLLCQPDPSLFIHPVFISEEEIHPEIEMLFVNDVLYCDFCHKREVKNAVESHFA